jgi:hypothetical protein
VTTNWQSAVDSGIIILGVSVAGYSIAFAFDVGYLSMFAVPSIFAEVELKGLLLCAGTIAAVYTSLDGAVFAWNQRPRTVTWQIVRAAYLLILSFAFVAWFFDTSVRQSLWLLGVSALLLTGVGIFAARRKTRAAPASPPSPSGDNRGPPALTDSGLTAIIQRSISDPILGFGFVIAWVAVVVAYYTGNIVGKTQDIFAVSQGTAPCAVLRERDDRLLCVVFDANTLELTGDMRFLKKDEVLTVRKVGRLQAHKNPKPK